jgi:cell division protein FtsW (lipid II flippase)
VRAPRTHVRRRTELGLILLAFVITGAVYTLASLGRTADIPANIGPFLGIVFGLLAVAHLATRRLAPDADPILLPMAALLNGIGYVFIARLDEGLAGLQALWTAVGIGAYVLTLFLVRRTRTLERYRYSLMLLGLALLLMPLVPGVGQTIRGAKIWVSIGALNFQPGEFAKIVFAAYLVDKREVLRVGARRLGRLHLPDLRTLGPVLLAWITSLVVMGAERDLGTSLLFFALFVVMLWVATDRATYLVLGAGLFAGGAWFAWKTFDHVQTRVEVWLDPWQDVSGKGYQTVQATFALAWGGVVGTGIGLGNPDRIPIAPTDFIFAAIGEELGLLGAAAVLIAFLLMVGSGLRIAQRAETPFDTLLAVGLTTIIGIQSFIIIGGVIRLVPLTGITLPFVSYGGSSLVANYVLLALLLRISDNEAPRIQAAEETRVSAVRAGASA